MSAQAVRLSNVDINNALENKEFEVLFQPIFDLGNGALARMETFVRWRHPSLGVLPPGAFISYFESQGRMGELTRYILNTALERYTEWRGPYAPGFSVNLSLADLADDEFASHLTKAIEAIEFPADLITLECPMPAVDSDLDDMAGRFARLRETGVRLAIEVRGRANDFLRTVKPFPFDEIKTGGSSILRFARTVRGPGLSAISDLLDIAKKANAVTTAVGIEDQASLAALRDLGFTAAQGSHLAQVGDLNAFRPAQVNSVRELLGLPALNGDELAALFRTAAPSPMAGEMQEDAVAESNPEAAPASVDAAEEKPASAAGEDREALIARARKKAKAIALAKRAKARDARKAAAIKRAKAKVALAKQQGESGAESGVDASENPRDLQTRIAEEFTGPVGDAENQTAQVDALTEEAAALTDPGASPMTGDTPLSGEDGRMTDPAPATQPAASQKAAIQLKMQIGHAGVYFHPGVSVVSGAPTLHSEDAARAPVPNPASPMPNHGADEAIDVTFVDEAELRSDDAPEQAPAPEPAPVMRDQAGDEAPMPADAGTGQPRCPKSRKNFLQRRYQFPPDHFWPKSWKRAWRKLAVSRDEAGAGA